MIRLVYGREFLKSAQRTPDETQRKLAELMEIFPTNPFHPFLHTKYLTGRLAGLLSFRITRDWRVIFQFLDQQTVQFIRVKHRRDIYR